MTYFVIETALIGVCVNQKRRGHVVGSHSSRKIAASDAMARNRARSANTSIYFLSVPVSEARKKYELSA